MTCIGGGGAGGAAGSVGVTWALAPIGSDPLVTATIAKTVSHLANLCTSP